MSTVAYALNGPPALPHLLAVWRQLPGTIYVDERSTEWVKKYNVPYISFTEETFLDVIKDEVNIIIFEGEFLPETLQTIRDKVNIINLQHGVSEKEYVYGRSCLELANKGYHDHTISPSVISSKMLTIEHEKAEFARPVNTKKTILYMPTFNLHSMKYLDEIKTLSDSYNLIVKVHPLTPPIDLSPNIYFVEPTDYLFVNYDLLFKLADLLIADYSSIIYEFTRYKKPILLMPPKSREWDHGILEAKKLLVSPYCYSYNGNITSSVELALANPVIKYPNYFYTNNLIDEIKRCLK